MFTAYPPCGSIGAKRSSQSFLLLPAASFAPLHFLLLLTKKISFPMGIASQSAESASDRSLFLLSPKPSFLTGESLFFFLKPPICAPFILILSLSPGCRLGQSICRVHPSAGQSSTPAAVLNTSTNNNF